MRTEANCSAGVSRAKIFFIVHVRREVLEGTRVAVQPSPRSIRAHPAARSEKFGPSSYRRSTRWVSSRHRCGKSCRS